MILRVIAGMAILAAGPLGLQLKAQQPDCQNLASARLPRITINSATPVPAGPFALPGTAPTAPKVQVPAFCRVQATVDKEVRIEIWMPRQWNHKLLAVGNGGMAGALVYGPMVKPMFDGYATSSTDTGHVAAVNTDADWALGNPERILNYADRGIHILAEADKVILNAYYSAQPAKSYFSGCSQGGHEAMMEVQRYPNDFDGIIAGDPNNFWTHHYMGGHLWMALAMEGDGYMPKDKVQLVGDAVNQQCDMLDGVKDGVLTDPRRCKFDVTTLRCKGADTTKCLTNAQVSAVQKIWTGMHTSDGRLVFPPLVPGGEAGPGGWQSYLTGTGPGEGRHAVLAPAFFRFFLFEDPSWDMRKFRFTASDGFDSDIDYTDSKLAALFNAVNPDLSPFKAHGGKLIQYHGWSDPDISPLNSINYFESVAKTQGGDTSAFYRLFMVPGMWHCGNGPGATSFDMLGPLDQWADKGIAPDKVIASRVINGKTERTRPLCPHPQEAQWKGTGSTDDAANFVCAIPKP